LPDAITLADIHAARASFDGTIYDSPSPYSAPLSEIIGCSVYRKLDYLQRTGSFKERGARYALSRWLEQGGQGGVMTASAGNHAMALAHHAKLLGLPVTVVMPHSAPLIKVSTCRQLGAEVILEGRSLIEAKHYGKRLAQDRGLHYVHGFDDPAIIAGQGTLGVEVLEQVPEADAIVVPVGGGGLIAGISTAVKALRPDMQVIGIEPEAVASFAAALQSGGPVEIEPAAALADGLAVGCVGEHAFAAARDKVDRWLQVDERTIALSILRLLELEKSVVEGAGAATLAALISGQLPELAGKRVVLLLCGGNIDLSTLHRMIDHGMAADGRLWRFYVAISDRPGGLEKLAHTIASTGASIKEITHDRTFAGPDITRVRAACTVETMDRDHIDRLRRALTEAGFAIDEDRAVAEASLDSGG